MIEKIYVLVGTNNEAKVIAVERALDIMLPNCEKKIIALKVESGVDNQPFGFDNIIKGAINRARNALNSINKSNLFSNKNNKSVIIGIGIEAGIVKIDILAEKYMDFQFTAIIQKDGEISLGCSSGFEYPICFIKEINENPKVEIGDIIDRLTKQSNMKEKNGAIGFLTNNKLNRTEILMNGVIMALLPIVNKELYNQDYNYLGK